VRHVGTIKSALILLRHGTNMKKEYNCSSRHLTHDVSFVAQPMWKISVIPLQLCQNFRITTENK